MSSIIRMNESEHFHVPYNFITSLPGRTLHGSGFLSQSFRPCRSCLRHRPNKISFVPAINKLRHPMGLSLFSQPKKKTICAENVIM